VVRLSFDVSVVEVGSLLVSDFVAVAVDVGSDEVSVVDAVSFVVSEVVTVSVDVLSVDVSDVVTL